MKIVWKKIGNNQEQILNSWMSNIDKQNLCLTKKSWQKTATDINECIKFMDKSQFINVMGFVNNVPVVAIMFGIEQENVLNIYDIIVNPKYRNNGIAKLLLEKFLKNDIKLELGLKYNYKTISITTCQNNYKMQNLIVNLGFAMFSSDAEYLTYRKDLVNVNENIK